ncbi:MAG TPA: response regulator, partial [Bacteroidia bacterium]|nr:response regulator [Bacteroidia bacterium]
AMDTGQAIKILLVDDRKEDILSLEVTLANANYQFDKATSGREALRILLKEHEFALILIDVQMPLLDGFETAQLIRESDKLKHIPIIFLTANNDRPNNIFKGYQAGAVDFMIKPLVPEIIRAKVAVFAELYKKNKELLIQQQNLLIVNRELEHRSEELARSNKNLEKFAYVASHDMQEPLRTIISYIELIEKRFGSSVDADMKKYMEYVVGAGYRMRELITGLLEYSRADKEEMPFQDVNGNDVLKAVLANLNGSIEDNHATVQCETLPTVKASYMQMVQLFQNLISNGIKFKRDSSPNIKVTYKKIEGYHLFSINDNGIGIEPEYKDKIFEIFKRLHPIGEYIGVGIGLAIVKRLLSAIMVKYGWSRY